MADIEQPYTDIKGEESTSLPSFIIWAVLWVVVLLALLPR
jgi:hypothetical protein